MKIALHDVSCRLEKGQNLGVIGESGSGKSTLARAIAGLLPPAQGRILLDGHRLDPSARTRSKEDLRRLQIVFQLADTALNPAQPVGDIIGRPLTFYHGTKGAAREARVAALLDMVRLPRAMRHRLPGELSGGQKQRVNLARALAADPEVILCDEITSALDTVVGAAVIDLLKELQRELDLSYVFISHDLSTVQAICDQVMVMHHGRVVETLPARDQVAFHRLVDLFQRLLEPGKVDLAVVLQRDLGKDGQGRTQLGDVDQRRIAGDIARLLQLLHPHQAGAGRQMHQIRQLDIGDAAVLLQLVQDADVDAVQLHGGSPLGGSSPSRICGDLNRRGRGRPRSGGVFPVCPMLPQGCHRTARHAAPRPKAAHPAGIVRQNGPR
ncbi:ABC transporter ATP-binding protein [Paracoccus hibiscisoli]|uniref:ABC transporter ATP-binding protein n=1 Tax=Paracoccus hibiscisoli TaxID=2023261 RepID=A0A4U0QT60_9RHOB|nr:ABC transporter ATP-binding protein [Paracoccus hibiscisoli]